MKLGLILCLVLCALPASAQLPSTAPAGEEKALQEAEMARYAALLEPSSPSTVASDWFDVTSYEIRLTVAHDPGYLSGSVRIRGVVRAESADTLRLDLSAPMIIDSVVIGTVRAAVSRSGASFTVTLDRGYVYGEPVDLEVFYQGLPVSTGFGSFVFGRRDGVPWIWSLSEPYGSKDWWPCKDNPADKADSVDIIIRCDSSLRVASNGLLRSVTDNGDGTRTHHWHEGYPIATYLVGLSISNFVSFSNYFVYSPTDSMEILNYVRPDHLGAALASLPKTVDMLRIFTDRFGPYPFLREKYGHMDFNVSGGMEHQTMTSTSTYSESVISHELGHQWFGDLITCRNWPHLWLNEGFAQYSTALYYEQMYGAPSYWSYINLQYMSARDAVGPLVLADTSSVGTMFPHALVYSKGASVLHMLRGVLGDTLFFRSLQNYAGDSALAYGSALTEDFQSVCEATSGMSLGYFFSEWAYGTNYPRYRYSWTTADTSGGTSLRLTVRQSTGTPTPAYFTMPMDVKISSALGDTTVRIFNDQPVQEFSWVLPFTPIGVALDPDDWILKTDTLDQTGVADAASQPSRFRLGQNYPNPFNGETQISFSVPSEGRVVVAIWTTGGERVEVLTDGDVEAGEYRVRWDAGSFASGVYLARGTFRPRNEQRSATSVEKVLLLK